MPTIPTLQNSPSNFSSLPIKNAVSAANAGEDGQPPGTAFSGVLAHQMNGKHDAAEGKSVNTGAASTAQDKVPENMDATTEDLKDLMNSKESKEPGVLVNLEDPETYSRQAEEKKEMETDTMIAMATAAPELKDVTNVMPGPIAGHSLHAAPEVSTEIQAGMPAEGRTEARIGDRTNSPNDRGVDAKADASQEEWTATVDCNASIIVVQPGQVAVHYGKAGSEAMGTMAAMTGTAATTPIASNLARTAGMSAAAATQARAKQVPITQDINDSAGARLELGARQTALQQLELHFAESNMAGQIGQSGKFLPEIAPKDMHIMELLNTSTALPVIATEYSAVAAAMGIIGTTGPFIHNALWLEPRIGTTGWDNALGQKMLWMASNQQQVAELSLDPPELGPLQVTLSIANDQASATFVSQHADVRQTLEAALPRLKEMMAESGINLGSATVSAETSQQQGGFERQHRSGTPQGLDGESRDASNAKNAGIGMSYIAPGGNRLVDTFA
ncbi:MAG: flagellar hook-length control protein FliK [Pseudomonadota bacterium]|nr:flagellar hook-length control protein FliK [Pseudomonadota bacterium]